jgi:CTP:molybdopterin cytidylyltransferase MocA
MIPAIILAAGASSRMNGRPKALLRAGDHSFVGRILDTLRQAGVCHVAVVVRPGHDEVMREIEAAGAGPAVVNPRAEAGQLSSLIAGLDALDAPGIEGVLVTLVDIPLVTAATIRTLVARAERSPAPIVRAAHRGRHGHPVIFARAVFEALRHADPGVGAKAVFREFAVEDVEVDDPGVVEDVDTPGDYQRLFNG